MKRGGPLQRRTPLRTRTGLATRTPLKAKSAPTRSTPIPPVSKKRARENRMRRGMAARLYPDRPLCSVWEMASNTALDIPAPVVAACRQWADDLHEPLTRARSGSITDEANACPLCRPCHDAISFWPESRLDWAYSLGLLWHSWDTERRSA
jgi:hypothetical protein